MQTTKIFLAPRFTRQFFISSVNQNNASRQGRFMDRLLRGSNSKRKWFNTNDFAPSTTIPGAKKRTPSVQTTRRMSVLNKVFMQHITDLMSTGEASVELMDRVIEVSHVEVSSNFKIINVFWIDHETDLEHYAVPTEDLLDKCARTLRHELSQLRVIGVVPPIQFVKCKHSALQKEIDRRLQIADYGEDFVPTIYPCAPHQIVTVKDSFNDGTTEIEKKNKSNSAEDPFQVIVPVMRNDVFDLDHSKIMSKIKVSLNASRQGIKKRALNAESNASALPIANLENNPSVMTETEQKDQFAQFLANRKKAAAHRYEIKYGTKRDKVITDIQEDYEYDDDFVEDSEKYDVDDYEDEFDDYDDDTR